eukprot:2747226-Prymnesium_polylepis.1
MDVHSPSSVGIVPERAVWCRSLSRRGGEVFMTPSSDRLARYRWPARSCPPPPFLCVRSMRRSAAAERAARPRTV